MNLTKFKIVADSSADLQTLSMVPYESAPLKIMTAQKEYVDDAFLDVGGMVEDLLHYNGKSSTSCPNSEDFLKAFGEAEHIVCVTITATLSGSYNSAMLAKAKYEEMYPDRRVFVFNSLTTGPEIGLMIEKVRDLVLEGKEFEEICEEIKKYSHQTGLLFMLESLKNLAHNGRVSPIVAKMAGLLGVRLVGKASDQGDLEPLSKCRGEKKALDTILQHLRKHGLTKGKVRIAHCFNERAGNELKNRILSEFKKVRVELYPCRGLCSFYAEKGGMLIGYEKF